MATTTKTPRTFGGRIKYLRELIEPELSQHELDKLAGLHRGHTWQIEEGNRDNPTTETLSGFKRVFGVSLDWLASGEGELPDTIAARDAVSEARERAKGKRPRERAPRVATGGR